MGRHAGIDHIREHLLVIADLEFLRIRIKAKFLDQIGNPQVPLLKIFNGEGCGHDGEAKPRRRGRGL